MRRARRDFEVFSLSFLDVICCGFGAIILLLVLTKFGEPLAIEEARRDLDRLLIELEAELYEIRGETTILDRRLRGKVKKCFQFWGFSAETVKVRFVVAGTTGKVAGVHVLGRYSDSPAAKCATKAANRMRFNRFQMSLQHVTLPIWVD